MRVLIIEDEKRLADALCQILKQQHYQTDAVYNGLDGQEYALSGQYDVIILDLMLPGKNGLDIASALRKQHIQTPVIMLTARSTLQDKVSGLDAGADDYLTKPFDAEELLARVRALSRRQGDMQLNEMSFGDLTLNLNNHDLTRGTRSVRLSFKEFEVLRLLLAASGALVSKEDIIVKVWGADSEAGDNNVEAYVSFLRKKCFYLRSEVSITTQRKVGYKLEVESA